MAFTMPCWHGGQNSVDSDQRSLMNLEESHTAIGQADRCQCGVDTEYNIAIRR
jgi:hypothetical protein